MKEYKSYIMRYDGLYHLAYWTKEYLSYIMRYDG